MIAPLFGSITRPLLSPLVSGLRDELFGAFTPRSLFNDGSIGVLYDNNDLSSFYLDAAGVTPATVNGLVGLQLDKSGNLALGADFCVNGGFATDTTWVKGTGWAISGGVATKTPGVASTIVQGITPIVGRAYKIEYFVSGRTAGSCTAALVGGTAVAEGLHTQNGFRSCILIANAGNNTFGISADGAFDGSIDNFTIKELPGNHRYQSTTGSKPILRGTPTGAELFTAYGTPGAGWSVAGATGTATTASSALQTTTAATVGKHYRVTYTVTRSAGSVQLSFGGRTGVSRSAAGQYVEYFDNALNTNALTATGTGFTGTVRIDEVKDVSAGSVTAPYGLQYDGVDDFLQTPSVNFSATDKMFVCAGVRKLSDAIAFGMVCEFSADANGNNGVFYLVAPSLAGTPSFGFISKGTTQGGNPANGYPAPFSGVISGIGNISGDSVILRVNGAQASTSSSDQGTGNYGNYPLFIGRRGGTSLPYVGLDFGFVIVGKTLTAAQISSTERWMAQRTGVSI